MVISNVKDFFYGLRKYYLQSYRVLVHRVGFFYQTLLREIMTQHHWASFREFMGAVILSHSATILVPSLLITIYSFKLLFKMTSFGINR